MRLGKDLKTQVRGRGHTDAGAGLRRRLRTRNIMLAIVGTEAVLLALLRIAGCS
jgi:hypothetical protein